MAQLRWSPAKLGRDAIGVTLALAALTVSDLGAAQSGREPRGLLLDYQAPQGCGSSAEVLEKLAAALGPEPDAPVPLSAKIVVAVEGAGFTLEYHATNDGGSSHRTLDVASCAEATEAAALLLLLSLDPVLADTLGAADAVGAKERPPTQAEAPPDAPPPEPGPTVAPETPSPPAPPQTPPPVPVDRPESTFARPRPRPLDTRGALGLAAVLVTDMTPTPAFGVGLHGSTWVGPFGVALGAAFAAASSAPISDAEGATVRSTLLRAYLRPELRFGTDRLAYGPYVGVGIERVSAATEGTTRAGEGQTGWLCGSGGAEISAAIAQGWQLTLGVGVVVPLGDRPRFWVTGIDEPVHRPGSVGFDALLGIFRRWGSQM